MRVHGDKIIRRKKDVQFKKDYHNYYDELKSDFYSTCGYCGKNSDILARKFTIDHFVPKSLDSERKNDYSNLVFACRKCNRNKSNYWPTKNKKIPRNSKEGFVDPATKEFDNHLTRDDEGNIRPLTKVGQYMYDKLKFNIRPTRVTWKLKLLKDEKEKLSNYIKKHKENKDKLLKYWEVAEEIDDLLKYLLKEGEIS